MKTDNTQKIEQLEKQNEAMRGVILRCCCDERGKAIDRLPMSRDQIDAALTPSAGSEFVAREEHEALQTQRDQVLHLLSGGTLTEQEVKESGLGIGVLSEQRHHEYMRTKAETERDKLRAQLAKEQQAAIAIAVACGTSGADINGLAGCVEAVQKVCAQLTAATQRAEKAKATCRELTTCDDALSLAESLAKASIENNELRTAKEKAEAACAEIKRFANSAFDAAITNDSTPAGYYLVPIEPMLVLKQTAIGYAPGDKLIK